jgi:SagB-type dehydrogenase family enzyme
MTKTISDDGYFRDFLKDSIRLQVDFTQTDQHCGIAPPPVQKKVLPNQLVIDLPSTDSRLPLPTIELTTAIAKRSSHRRFSDHPLQLQELSYLLWATQGVRGEIGPGSVRRTVPSAGCRHALETYLCVYRVEGLESGLYRYLPLGHQICRVAKEEYLAEKVGRAALGQTFVGKGAVTFVWTAVPYRMEWRYGPASYKVIALDAGHVAQNLYLACEAIGAGTCAIAAYHQELMDALLQVDGIDEFVIYLAPVGKI